MKMQNIGQLGCEASDNPRCEALKPMVLSIMALYANASENNCAQTSGLVIHNRFRYARIFMYLENCIQRNDDKIISYAYWTANVQ